MKTITVLGSYSGRNAGEVAILGNLLHDISNVRPDIRFLVPTINPRFIYRSFGQYNIKAPGLMPWNGALKILGIPTFQSMVKTDMVLITDNMLFDRKFYNPLVNYLSTISLVAPFCKKRGVPIVFYNASIGPITSSIGAIALQKVLDACPLMILRDKQTKELLQRLNLRYPDIIINADCAINTTPPSDERLNEIIKKEGLFRNTKGTISFTINTYIDKWYSGGTFKREIFLKLIGATIDYLINELDVNIMLTVTQVMDMKINKEIFKYVKHPDRIQIISNVNYSYQDIAGLLQRVGIHVGLRTHSLILSAAVNTPMISINSYPKNEGFMQSIKQDDWMIEINELTFDKLSDLTMHAWKNREKTRKTLRPIVEGEKLKARRSAMVVSDLLQ